MPSRYVVSVIWIICSFFVITTGEAKTPKIIIGQTATVFLQEANFYFTGRVDTGAATSSINAQNIRVFEGKVAYTVVNECGEQTRISSRIARISNVKNAESIEQRIFVRLTLHYQGYAKNILVNLNNRHQSNYKLLLGRNWLSGDYLVDVDR